MELTLRIILFKRFAFLPIVFSSLFLLTKHHLIQAQPKGTGLIFDDTAYQKIPLMPSYEGEKYIGTQPVVSLKKYCPTPGDQERTGACVGWACGYAALTIHRAINNKVTNQALINKMAHSAAFIFNQIKEGGCEEGARIPKALSLLKEQGDCLRSSFENKLIDCNTMPDKMMLQEAAAFKVKEYAALFATDTDPTEKILLTLKMLSNQKPVIVGMKVTSSFWNLKSGQRLWSPSENDFQLKTPYGHAMVVVGYNDIKKTFELMNSYGINWGNKGFIEIPYEVYGKYVKYAFHLVLPEKPLAIETPSAPIFGAFNFRYPKGYTTDSKNQQVIIFENAHVNYNPDRQLYETTRKNWRVFDVFQLVAQNLPIGTYIYAFSKNPKGEVKIHFPLNNTANWMPNEKTSVIIPEKDKALRLEKKGEDILCVLYTNRKIENMKEKLDLLQELELDFISSLYQAFADELLPQETIFYELARMGFTLDKNIDHQGAVPLILAVSAL